MHVSSADVGDTSWLQAESVENNFVTEPRKAALLKCWPHFVQDLNVDGGTYSEIVYAVIPEKRARVVLVKRNQIHG